MRVLCIIKHMENKDDRGTIEAIQENPHMCNILLVSMALQPNGYLSREASRAGIPVPTKEATANSAKTSLEEVHVLEDSLLRLRSINGVYPRKSFTFSGVIIWVMASG